MKICETSLSAPHSFGLPKMDDDLKQLSSARKSSRGRAKARQAQHVWARTHARDMGTSPSVFVEAHIKKKRASPSKSRKNRCCCLAWSRRWTWRTLPVGEKIAWVKEVKDILAKLEVKIEEERRRSPLSMAAVAPLGPSTAMVPSSMPSSSSDAIVKNENDGVTYLGEPLLECTFAFGGSKRKQRGNWQLRRKLEKVAHERCSRRRLVLSFACVCKHPRCRNVRVGMRMGWMGRAHWQIAHLLIRVALGLVGSQGHQSCAPSPQLQLLHAAWQTTQG